MHIHWNWRLASRLSVVILAAIVILVVVIFQQRSTPSLHGTELERLPAPDFTLTDQLNQHVSLSQFKGKPVVVTFLFTNCPDVCPLTAEYLHQSLESLGNDAANIGVLAVSTDPARDDVAAALRFSQNHRMEDRWHFLVGSKEELAPIWSNYSIYVQNEQEPMQHTSAIYLIDKEGNERIFMGDGYTPNQITENLRALLQE